MEDSKKSMKSKILKLLGVVTTVAILASMLVAPASALTSSGLVVAPLTISAGAKYTMTINLGATVAAGAGAITVTFPTGVNIALITAAADGDVTLEAGPGLGTGAYALANVATVTTGQALAITTTANIGAGAIVQIVVGTGLATAFNPATVGDYTVTVKTSAETTAINVGTFTTVVPAAPVLPGVASVYNSAGILMSASNSLTTALAAVLAGGTIKLTPGTYDTPAAALVGNALACTISGTATAAEVIIKSNAAWAMTGTTVVIENVTIDASLGGVLTMTNATAGTIKNSIIKGAVAGVNVTFTGAGVNTVDTCTFTVATGSTGVAAGAATTVKTSAFTMAGTGVGIAGAANVTSTTNTFTGTTGAGLGIVLTGGAASAITGSTFTGLTTALTITTPAAAAFDKNIVDACGVTLGADTIVVVSTAGLSVTNNKITNSKDNIINVAANDNLVVVMFNEFAGNVTNATNTGGAGLLNMTHNFWTVAAPASTATVSYANALAKKATDGRFSLLTTLDATTAAGVNVVASTLSTLLGATLLAENPVGVAVTAGTVKRYYDVFGVGTTAATIRFSGASTAAVAAGDAIYYYNSAFGRWDLAAQTINVFGGYIEVTVGVNPTAAQFVGLPFALVTVPAAPPAAPNLAIGSGAVPALGATGVAVDTTLAWAAVAGATSYDIVIAEDSTLADKFAVINYSATSPIAMHKIPADQILKYDQIYWWRVRSVSAAGASAWTISSFTTMKEPAAPTVAPTTTVVTTTVPVVTSVPAPIITVQIPTTEPVEVIPPYLLWAVVAVGIILVIAVVVLIVRTRRIS